MKLVKASQDIVIPDDVKLEVKARKIRVTGPRGSLTRDFKHLAVDMYKTQEDIQPEDEEGEGEVTKGPLKLRVDCHFGKRKRLAAIRTCTSHVENMIKGVTKGFEYKMRLVYAHFPINANITNEGGIIEVRNFLGEKRVRIVKMLPGVKIVRSTNVKDELVLSGSDIELVSKSAALINMSCHVKKKDIRKFLDGVYVSEKGSIVKDD